MKIVSKTEISAYPLAGRGKARDIYEIDSQTLLIVATDRMSAYDAPISRPAPYKGVVLNQLTLFWMRKFESIIPNHILDADAADFPKSLSPWRDELEGRAVIVRKADPLPLECVVRGYLAGSGWKSYQKNGEICGVRLPRGLDRASRIDPPIFTPTTKAAAGAHDESLTFSEAAALAGDEAAEQARLITLNLYSEGAAYAASRGIIVADTKFELGFINGVLHLIDEVLTPDSSRFWPASEWKPGIQPPSFDKQFLRDWLDAQGWDHTPPAPQVPEDVMQATAERYYKAYEAILGKKFPA